MEKPTASICGNRNDLLAKEQEISLTEEEMENVKRAAKTYYDSLSQAEKTYTGAGLADLEGMYEDYALANKVYHVLTEGVNAEVSDDEARIMEAMQIYLKDENKAGEVKEKLSDGEDFAAVASNYIWAEGNAPGGGRGCL